MSRRYLSATAYRQQLSQLVQRDLAVLKWVADLRFVSGSQLTRLCFMDTDDPTVNARASRRALLRLTRLGLLDRLPRQVGGVRSGSVGFVYHLGLGGQRLAIERGWQPEGRRRRSLIPGTLFVRHSLQVSELHTLLMEADRKQSFELLELSGEPSCWRSFDGHSGQRQMLKPDSFVRLASRVYEDSYFIEVDMGTEGSQALERQLRLYIAYFESGQEQAEHGVFPKTLWLSTTDKRVEAIAASVRRQPMQHRALFQVGRFDQAIAQLINNGE